MFELDYGAGFAAVILGAISAPAIIFGSQFAHRASSPRWQRILIGYPLLCVGMLGLSLFALMILINMLAPFAIAIWSLFH